MAFFAHFDAMTLAFCSALISGAMLAFMLLMRFSLSGADRRLDAWIVGDLILLCARTAVTLELTYTDVRFMYSPLALVAPLAFAAVCTHAVALRLGRHAATNLQLLIPGGLASIAGYFWLEHSVDELQVREFAFVAVFASWSWMLYEAVRIARGSFGAKALTGLSALVMLADLAGFWRGAQNPTVQFGMFVQLLLAIASTPCFLMWFQESLRQRLAEIADTDALTGTLNRHGLVPRLQRAITRARHEKHPLSVAIFDLDHFKMINDLHGHQIGDHVLQYFSRTVRSSLRVSDLLGRWGGEEFLVVLPDTALAAASAIAERIRATCDTPAEDVPRFTVSAGVASLDTSGWNLDVDALLAQADQCLYAAKVDRNRVVAQGVRAVIRS